MFKVSKAQVAHLITVPLIAVFTVAAGWLARHFPGLPAFNNEQVTAFAGLIGLTAAGIGLHYLKGLREWQKLEAEGIISTGEPDELDARLHGVPVSRTAETVFVGDAGRAHVEADPEPAS